MKKEYTKKDIIIIITSYKGKKTLLEVSSSHISVISLCPVINPFYDLYL